MKKLFWILALSAASSPAFGKGGTVGNPGDLVVCRPSDNFSEKDIYTLDYALGIGIGYRARDFAEVRSWEESSRRIRSLLAEAVPEGLERYDAFVSATPERRYVAVTSSPRYFWSPTDSRALPVRTGDRGDTKALPAECSYQLRDQAPRFSFAIRVILRHRQGDLRFFTYNRPNVQDLHDSSALQYSMLMLHEWLWDLTPNIEVNRKANLFLHSKRASEMSSAALRKALLRMGVRF